MEANGESGQDFRQALARFAAEFEPAHSALLPGDEEPNTDLPAAMNYATMGGGKYLRPFLVRCSADMFGVPPEFSQRVGSAVEVIHAYSLVHDDLPALDNDDLRRGRPTCHRKFGEATALLAGDGLLTLAFEILAGKATHDDPETRLRLVEALARAAGASGMVGGQMIDLDYQNRNVSFATAEILARKKTGALFSFSAGAGAILGNADQDEQTALAEFGSDLGLAFQIVDDFLDIEGDESRIGKRVGKDSDAGKATFISILGADQARNVLDRVSDSALSNLARFGNRADSLRAITEFILVRDR